jgi:hypothetical protein
MLVFTSLFILKINNQTMQSKTFLLFYLLCICQFDTNAQFPMEMWHEQCNLGFPVTIGYRSSNTCVENKAMAALADAYGFKNLYERNHDQTNYQKSLARKSEIDDLFTNYAVSMQELMIQNPCFRKRLQELRDYFDQQSYAHVVDTLEKWAGDFSNKMNEQPNPKLPESRVDFGPCHQKKADFRIGANGSIEFVFTVLDCDVATTLKDGYIPGVILAPEYFLAIPKYFQQKWVGFGFKEFSRKYYSNEIEIHGRADGNTVLGDLEQGFPFTIPKGTQYYLEDKVSGKSDECTLPNEIRNVIYNSSRANEHLSLGRAWASGEGLKVMDPKSIRYVAECYGDDDSLHRGVEIIIRFPSLLKKMMENEQQQSRNIGIQLFNTGKKP